METEWICEGCTAINFLIYDDEESAECNGNSFFSYNIGCKLKNKSIAMIIKGYKLENCKKEINTSSYIRRV